MDRGAWWATVHSATKGQTRWNTHTHTHTHTHTNPNYPPILIKPFFIGLYFKISAVGQVKFASSGTNSSVQFSHSVMSDFLAVIKVPATQMVSYSPGRLENNLTQTCCVKWEPWVDLIVRHGKNSVPHHPPVENSFLFFFPLYNKTLEEKNLSSCGWIFCPGKMCFFF